MDEKLIDDVIDAAVKWREAEVAEFETNLCDEREQRHIATYSALCFLRGKVMALMSAKENAASE